MKKKVSTYTPGHFVFRLLFRSGSGIMEKTVLENFEKSTGKKPGFILESPGFLMALYVNDSTRLFFDAQKKVYMLVSGQVFNLPGDAPVSLLKKYQSSGMEFVSELDGHFSIILCDLTRSRVYAASDRLNSRRIFFHRDEESFWVSNSLVLHPTGDLAMDNTAIASYLVNCALFDNRTLFSGVKSFASASINSLDKEGVKSHVYWEYRYSPGYGKTSKEDLIDEYKGLLTASVEQCAGNKERVFLSLSGGWDARAILGCLQAAGELDRVTALSYYQQDIPETGNDIRVSKRLCDLVGCRHHIIKSYRGDIESFIEQNAELGQGYAHFCTDVDAWNWLSEEFEITAEDVLLVGDVNLPQRKFHYIDTNSIMNWLFIYDASILKPYAQWFNQGYDNDLPHLWQAEYERLLDHLPWYDQTIDLRDYMYADLRLQNIILPWRFCFQAPVIDTAIPFLSNDIIDFTLKLPLKYRLNKSLFKETLTQMFPALFSIPAANAGLSRVDWDREIIQKKEKIGATLCETSSRFDEYMEPKKIIDYMNHISEKPGKKIPLYYSAAKSIHRGVAKFFPGYRDVLGKIPGINKIIDRSVNRVSPKMNYFLEKVLILRHFLRNN